MTVTPNPNFGLPITIPPDCIATLYAGRFGRFQIVHCSGIAPHSGAVSSTRGYHVIVPMAGALLWHRKCCAPVFANAKTILHVEANDDYKVTHPAGTELSAVCWPAAELVDELACGWKPCSDRQPTIHSCNGAIQIALRRLVCVTPMLAGTLAFEETLIAVMRRIYARIDRCRPGSARSLRTINCAKEFLHANLDTKLSLTQIAQAAGVSPIYLTQLFSASEGVPLYRYHLDLRLTAALGSLSDTRTITGVALDLGFSSHAHFSTEFLRQFEVSPSLYRAFMRDSRRASDGDHPRLAYPAALPEVHIMPLCEAKGGPAPWRAA